MIHAEERQRHRGRENVGPRFVTVEKWPFQYEDERDDVDDSTSHLLGPHTKRHTQLEPHFIGIWSAPGSSDRTGGRNFLGSRPKRDGQARLPVESLNNDLVE